MSMVIVKGNEGLIEIINEVTEDWIKEGKMDEEIAKYADPPSKKVEELR